MTTATFDQLGPRDMRDLREDTRGAVMVMGLFMATFLIGAMWFMKGIGDAVVFKDRMQEAADHVAFTSAVVHARGMNIISVINIVMYVIALIWVILCMLKDLLDLAVALLTTCAATVVGCAFCCEALPIATAADRAVTVAKNAYEASAVNVGLPALSLTGTAVAIGYPWYGTYAGYSVGSDYKSSGFAIGPSNIPGMNFSMNLDKYFGGGKPPSVPATGSAGAPAAGGSKPSTFTMKLGLPVVLSANSDLCLRFTGSLKGFFPSFLGSIISWVGGRFVEARGYCNGGVWSNKNLGWKKWYSPAKNGNDWLQIWSILTPEKYDEGNAESKVALAIGSKGSVYAQSVAARGAVPQAPIYSAEAEFYYDCDGKFTDSQCNGEGGNSVSATEVTFNMRWMARLRHVRSPSLGALIGGALTNLFAGPVVDFLGGKLGGSIKGSDAYKAIEKGLGSGGPFLGAVVSDTIKKGTQAATSAINGAIDAPMGSPIPQVLH